MGSIEFHRLADRELNEAAQYYDGETPGLGLSFIREDERCIQSIAEQPEAGVILAGTVRRRLLRRSLRPSLQGQSRWRPDPRCHGPKETSDLLGRS